MNDSERSTAVLLEAASADLDPDVDRMVAGGVARGRHLRRRERVAASVATAAAVGVVGVLWTVVPGLELGDARETTAGPSTTVVDDVGGPVTQRRIGIDVAKTAAVLRALLPHGDTKALDAWGSDDVGDQYREGQVLYRGGHVTIRVEAVPRAALGAESGCREAEVGCRLLDDGARLRTRERSGPGAEGLRSRTVVLDTPDGFRLTATAWNGPGPRGVEPVTEQPVLDEEQLARIVKDPIWLEDPQ